MAALSNFWWFPDSVLFWFRFLCYNNQPWIVIDRKRANDKKSERDRERMASKEQLSVCSVCSLWNVLSSVHLSSIARCEKRTAKAYSKLQNISSRALPFNSRFGRYKMPLPACCRLVALPLPHRRTSARVPRTGGGQAGSRQRQQAEAATAVWAAS